MVGEVISEFLNICDYVVMNNSMDGMEHYFVENNGTLYMHWWVVTCKPKIIINDCWMLNDMWQDDIINV